MERAALRQRLAQSEKLAALGQFVAGIAHELNNPLQGVLGHIELIAATNALSPALKKDFRTVSREAERAAKIVRNLLVFTGSQKLLRRRFSLNAVVGRVLALRSDALREGHVKVTRSYEANLPRLSGDPMLVQQALINILMNAEQAVAAASPRRIDVTTEFDETRGVRLGESARQRARVGGRRPDPDLRAVLHDKRGRAGHRARTDHHLWHHPGAPGRDHSIERARRRRGFHGRASRKPEGDKTGCYSLE